MKKITSLSIIALLVCAIVFLSIFFIQRSTRNSSKKTKTEFILLEVKDSNAPSSLSPRNDTVLYLNKRKVLIKTPGNTKKHGTFLVLHGWNFPPEDWCTKTSLCEKATEKGYYVVLPDMGKSTYHERTFPETRVDWRSYPSRKWLTDTLVPFLQKNYSLFLDNENNFIVGLSTGARGVALVVLDLPKLFKGAAALSGDYNQSDIPNDKISTGFYGPYKKFKKRWDCIDNAVFRIREFGIPFYLGHGKSDKVVPPQQTKLFYDSLVKTHPGLKVKLNMPKAGHDYNYWGSEVDNILKFFEELK